MRMTDTRKNLQGKHFVKKENELWEVLKLDKNRIERLLQVLIEPVDMAMKYPGRAVDELSAALDDYNTREMAFAFLHLGMINTRNRKRGDAAARLLIDEENVELVDNVLALFESIDIIMDDLYGQASDAFGEEDSNE